MPSPLEYAGVTVDTTNSDALPPGSQKKVIQTLEHAWASGRAVKVIGEREGVWHDDVDAAWRTLRAQVGRYIQATPWQQQRYMRDILALSDEALAEGGDPGTALQEVRNRADEALNGLTIPADFNAGLWGVSDDLRLRFWQTKQTGYEPTWSGYPNTYVRSWLDLAVAHAVLQTNAAAGLLGYPARTTAFQSWRSLDRLFTGNNQLQSESGGSGGGINIGS